MAKEFEQVVNINQYQIARVKADLKSFCKLLNELFVAFREKQLFLGNITLSMVQEAAVYNAETVCKCIDAEFQEAADKVSVPFAKREFLQGAARAKTEVCQMLNNLCAKCDKERLIWGLILKEYERQNFLTVKNDVIAFDERLVEECYTDTIQGEQAENFVKRLKQLVSDVERFNNDVKALSDGEVSGITQINDGCSLVSVDDYGYLHIDTKNLKFLNFDRDCAPAKSGAMIVWHGIAL